MSILTKFAYHPADNDSERLNKFAALIVSGSCCLAGIGWTIMYYLIFGLSIVTCLPALFVIIVGSCIAVSHFTKNHLWAVYSQIICIIYITSFIQWSIGGMFDSGFVMAWAFCGPMTALTFFTRKQSVVWFILFIINVLITAVFDTHFSAGALTVSPEVSRLFFIMNIGISSVVVFVFASFFVTNTLRERARADNLLLNILPKSIAKQLKQNTGIIAERHDNVSVLFADIVGFTQYASVSTPENLVNKLDAVFNRFDTIALKFNLEKIKTIGDAYMVAGGIPERDELSCYHIGMMAIEMQNELNELNARHNTRFSIRIGIHCGPVVAGVIGSTKFAYDLWGDTVNVASRMESSGESGKIQVSSDYYLRTADRFNFERRGIIDVKGKGRLETYLLISRKE